jgi:thiamine-monophosphate kinase
VVLVTGTIGDGYCGLESVFNPRIPVDAEVRNALIDRYVNPISRLKEARVIAESGFATAMIDISDGLSSDLLHICDSSGTGVEVYAARLPISEHVLNFSECSGVDACHYALVGGDDYGLLLTANENRYEELIKRVREETGTVLTPIGRILGSDSSRSLVLPDGSRKRFGAEGWQHFGVNEEQ